MTPKLHHNSVPRTSNFYESSFRQLSDIQQKQTGLLIGAVVADAAARTFDGCTAEEIDEFIKAQAKLNGDVGEEDPLVFSQSGPRPRPAHVVGAMRHRSYTCLLVMQLLHVMATARGEFPVNYVKDRWISIAHAHPQHFASEHASLLNVLGAVLSLPVIYPWADDATLRSYATPFIEFLTELPLSQETAEMSKSSEDAVRSYTFSALGVALRCLQSNPDPYRNAAMMAVPGTADIFPEEVAAFCPLIAQNELLSQLSIGASAMSSATAGLEPPPFPRGTTTSNYISGGSNTSNPPSAEVPAAASLLFPSRPLSHDIRTVREGLVVARRARSFADGVKAAIRMGGPVSQRSIIVGALLGARMGVRRIPPTWISATHDHSPLATMAIEVAQWSWNPPHH